MTIIPLKIKEWHPYPAISCRSGEKKYYKLIQAPNLSPPLNMITSIKIGNDEVPISIAIYCKTIDINIPLPSDVELRLLDKNNDICKIINSQIDQDLIGFWQIPWRIKRFGLQIIYKNSKITEWFETNTQSIQML